MNTHILWVIAGMGLVTYIPRWAPLYLLSRRLLPAWFVEWLDFIPAAILSALILPAILIVGDPRRFNPFTPEFFVSVPTLLVAVKTRSLAGTTLTGMALFWFIQRFL